MGICIVLIWAYVWHLYGIEYGGTFMGMCLVLMYLRTSMVLTYLLPYTDSHPYFIDIEDRQWLNQVIKTWPADEDKDGVHTARRLQRIRALAKSSFFTKLKIKTSHRIVLKMVPLCLPQQFTFLSVKSFFANFKY
jgi:hypothetical protein